MRGEPATGRTRVELDLEHARRFVLENHHAVLATRSRHGGVQQSPVLVGVDEQGRFTVSSREAAVKTRNLRRDPRGQLCVFPDTFFGDWIVIEGPVEVLPLPEAMEPLVDYYRRLAGEHPDWKEYRESMRREERVLLRMQARRVGPRRRL